MKKKKADGDAFQARQSGGSSVHDVEGNYRPDTTMMHLLLKEVELEGSSRRYPVDWERATPFKKKQEMINMKI